MLTAGEARRIKRAIRAFERRFPQTGFTVAFQPLGKDTPGATYTYWVFNRSNPAGELQQGRDNRHLFVLVDTAGRLQNRRELMDELAKIKRVLGRINPASPHNVVLVLDATTGQNALSQIEIFKEVAGVTGLVMTKLDGTARGGVLVAAAEKFGLPIHAVGVGETLGDLRPFDAAEMAQVIAGAKA